MQQISKLFFILAAGLLVVSCGVESSQTAGIDRGGVVSGPITGYGSIWVNGKRYETTSASITINGNPAVDDKALAIGQVVLLESSGPLDDLMPTSISYESNLRGPVESVDPVAGTFIALGQEVMVDAGTSFSAGIAPADITGLSVDDIVEVSGFLESPDLAGNRKIRATRVQRENGSAYELQLSGVVEDSVPNVSFRINNQLVAYAHPDFLGDGGDAFPNGSPGNGDKVRVVVAETVDPKFGASGEILATTVAYRGPPAATEDGEEGELEGLITCTLPAGSSCASFRLAGFDVVTSPQTKYPDGGSAADLADNIRIEAKGRFDGNGRLIAAEIEFREEGEARIEATVDSVNAAQNSLIIFGITVETTPLTRIEDKRDEIRPFGIGDLSTEPPDFLKIEGYWSGDRLIATGLERLEGEDKFQIRGPLTDALSPAFTLLGKIVETSATGTSFSVGELDGLTVTEFFNAVEACLPTPAGCFAEVSWAASGPLSFADEVELKQED